MGCDLNPTSSIEGINKWTVLLSGGWYLPSTSNSYLGVESIGCPLLCCSVFRSHDVPPTTPSTTSIFFSLAVGSLAGHYLSVGFSLQFLFLFSLLPACIEWWWKRSTDGSRATFDTRRRFNAGWSYFERSSVNGSCIFAIRRWSTRCFTVHKRRRRRNTLILRFILSGHRRVSSASPPLQQPVPAYTEPPLWGPLVSRPSLNSHLRLDHLCLYRI